MYPRLFEIGKDMLRPVIDIIIYRGTATVDGTTLNSAKFYLQDRSDGTMKLNGVAMTVAAANPLTLRYTWTGTDTNTAGDYNSWIIGYWSAGPADPEYFTGPEVVIFTAGSRLLH
jgi:hypothetical protein